MKIRSGFVSNSSSSSFTCDVCGENACGMDMGLSEAGMQQCTNGHTICDSHERSVEITNEEKRNMLIQKVNRRTWKKPEEREKEIAEINGWDDDKLNEAYDDELWDGGPESRCPLCMFEKLDSSMAVKFLLKKNGITEQQLLADMKAEYTTYGKMVETLIPKKS